LPLTTAGLKTQWVYTQVKDNGEINENGKYEQEKKEASDKVNKHTNNLYSGEICNVSRAQ